MEGLENAPKLVQWLAESGILNFLKDKFGVIGTLVVLGVSFIILLVLAIILLVKIIRKIYVINYKHHILFNITVKDFLASWGIILLISDIILMIVGFEAKDFVVYILLAIIGICSIIFYKNKIGEMKENQYHGGGLIGRFLITFVVSLFALPLVSTFLVGFVLKGDMLDLVSTDENSSNNIDIETGYITDENGNTTTYSKTKIGDWHETTTFKGKDGKDHTYHRTKM